MPGRIEDYALIGDCQSAGLVCRNGSIDWLCLPRFDSPACFAALLGDERNGRWLLSPREAIRSVKRSYRHGTLVLETELTTASGVVRLIDFMPPRTALPDITRIVEGIRGTVSMTMELILRFDYGWIAPWHFRDETGTWALAGPDTVHLMTPIEIREAGGSLLAEFTVNEGERVPFTLMWHRSHRATDHGREPEAALRETERWWREWSDCCKYTGRWDQAVLSSLITLKALTYLPTGALVAAVTTSLPEWPGSTRNWDYRYCWLRDATFTLSALMSGGYFQEARDWREWLLRAVAGAPEKLQIVYGIAGERRLTELELDWLPGYEGSCPVRAGNAAWNQYQVDVYGEVIDALYFARLLGLPDDGNGWLLQRALMDFLESNWERPDRGIWEVRGPERPFTHSKIMAWVAADRAVKQIEDFGLDGPIDRWKHLRDIIHRQVCEQGYDPDLRSFVQYYGSRSVDASLLLIPLVEFLPAADPRVRGTVQAIGRELLQEGFISRYVTGPEVDGLPAPEGAFLACTCWYIDNLELQDRHQEAVDLFERVLAIRNDVGLLPEQYDPLRGRFLGNFPQALSHLALINTARLLSGGKRPSTAQLPAG